MKVFLLKDVEKVGMAGEMVNVSDGFALNFLLPRKMGVEVTASNESSFARRIKTIQKRSEVVESQSSMLAERIKTTPVTISRKGHDGDKLYGAINPSDIVDALALKGISVSKSQVVIDKAIKKAGSHTVTIKLSSRLQPSLTVKVEVTEEE